MAEILRGCPRCRGDLRQNRDMYGEYRQCVQCGFLEDGGPVVSIEMAKAESKERDVIHQPRL